MTLLISATIKSDVLLLTTSNQAGRRFDPKQSVTTELPLGLNSWIKVCYEGGKERKLRFGSCPFGSTFFAVVILFKNSIIWSLGVNESRGKMLLSVTVRSQ